MNTRAQQTEKRKDTSHKCKQKTQYLNKKRGRENLGDMRNRKRRDPQKKKNINKWENSFYKKAIEHSIKQIQLDCMNHYCFVANQSKSIKQNT